MRKKKQFSVRMDEELVDFLDDVADEYGVSRCRLIELLIKEVINNEDEEND